MRAVTYQEPGRIAVEDRPEPEIQDPGDALIKVDAAGICGSDLHVYHATHREVERGFTIGHEYVGTVLAVGDRVTELVEGDRVLGSFFSSCGRCFQCRRSFYSQCENLRVFGFGRALGDLPGTQADQVLVPNAHLTLRRISPGLSEASALFAGDVMSTAYHSVREGDLRPGQSCAVVGLGPVGLCAVMVARAAGATPVLAFDLVEDRLEVARGLGAIPVHSGEEDVDAVVSDHTDGRGVDVAIEAVGHPSALNLATRLCRRSGTVSVVGIYSGTIEVAIGQIFGKNLTLRGGRANVIGNLDEVLALLEAGALDPAPLVSREMSLEEAPEAYEAFDRKEALKILLRP
jgi:2-desacetyl-2-hydroxyethyl bacteriochlorophyllide A dehydrogenase